MGLRRGFFVCLGIPKKDDKVPCLPLELFVNNGFFGMFAGGCTGKFAPVRYDVWQLLDAVSLL